MINYYKKSKKELKRVLRKNKDITRAEWDEYAHENYFFSAFTIMAHEDTRNWEETKKKLTW